MTKCAVRPCERLATVLVLAGCIHEHEIEQPMCPFHLERQSSSLRVSCMQCHRAGHVCSVGVIRTEPLPL